MIYNNKKKIFFKNLDGFRAIAALLVFVWHTELHKHHVNWQEMHFIDLGFMGVTIFLVLSGFLITYLLLEENTIDHKINYKYFYIRRILRIWPLYFLLLLFGYFIYPANMSLKGLLLSTFFLSNFAMIYQLLPTIIDPIWSLGMEEQFYLLQPHLLRIKNKKNLLIVIIVLIAIIYFLKFISIYFFPSTAPVILFRHCLAYFRYDCLLIGSLSAVLLYNENHKLFKIPFTLKPIFNKYVQGFCILYYITYILFGLKFGLLFNNVILTVVTAITIMNLCRPDTSIVSLQNKSLIYMGKISYGFYLMHKIPLFIILFIADKYMQGVNPLLRNSFIYFFSFSLSVLLASLSYFYYESYFLRLKSKYSRIIKQ